MPTLGAHIFRSQSSPPRLTTKKAMNQTRTTTLWTSSICFRHSVCGAGDVGSSTNQIVQWSVGLCPTARLARSWPVGRDHGRCGARLRRW